MMYENEAFCILLKWKLWTNLEDKVPNKRGSVIFTVTSVYRNGRWKKRRVKEANNLRT